MKRKKDKEKKGKRNTKIDQSVDTEEETNKLITKLNMEKKKLEEERKKEEEEREKKRLEEKRKSEEEKIKKEENNLEIKENKVKKTRKEEDEIHDLEELKNMIEKEKELEKSEAREVFIEYELYDLGSVVPRGEKTYKDMFKPYFPENIYTSFNKINSAARELNKRVEFPEFIFLGFNGSGKSSLIEALIGYPINNLEDTNRPIFFQLINNTECEKPRITIKRDNSLKGFEKDVEIDLDDIPSELRKRNVHVSDQPIYLNYEWRYCLNHTLIDSPGLGRNKDLDEISFKLAKVPKRNILVVQNSSEIGRNFILKFLKKIDPELVRSTFIYTKFYSEIKNYSSSTQINKLLSRNFDNITSFHTTVLSKGVRDTTRSDFEKFQQYLFYAYHRDINTAENLHYDKKYSDYLGLFQLRSFLQQKICFSFQENIPSILNKVRQDIKDSYENLIEIRKQLNNLESGTPKLRSLANSYVVEFLQIINNLISGSSEGNAIHNGQTLEEERLRFPGDNEWRNSENYPIEFHYEDMEKISHSQQKLYGGQQFERLLCEFSYIASVCKLNDPSMDEVATAAGINKVNNTPNYTWAACDLAQNSARENFLPLIKQLSSRATYVVNRLADISSSILESRKQQKGINMGEQNFDVNDTQQYRFFRNYVQELFENFVENQSKFCEVKCMDEFYSTKTIYWYQTENNKIDPNSLKDVNTPEATKKVVVEMAQDIFEKISKRILRNVLLKFYNFFLVPVQNQIWTFIQSKVSSLGDEDLIEKFELNHAKMSLKQDELKLKQNAEKLVEQEKAILSDSQTFSSIF